ncbi:hypothetical protein ACFWAP_12955 [Streptomyces goshikiensis]
MYGYAAEVLNASDFGRYIVVEVESAYLPDLLLEFAWSGEFDA